MRRASMWCAAVAPLAAAVACSEASSSGAGPAGGAPGLDGSVSLPDGSAVFEAGQAADAAATVRK